MTDTKAARKESQKKVRMILEEPAKSSTTEEQNPNLNPIEEPEEEPEEGEIVGDDESESSTAISSQVHPLEHSWTFWFHHPAAKSKQATWGSSLRSIYTFSTVEEFWSLYNNIPHPSKLAGGADLYCFKYKIEPKWEDPVCANGGKWSVSFQKGKSDTSWLYRLLAVIGEQFDHGDEICGAVVSVRARQDKIAIWTKNAANEAAQMSIAKQWKVFLDYNDTIGFIFHTMQRSSTGLPRIATQYELHRVFVQFMLSGCMMYSGYSSK